MRIGSLFSGAGGLDMAVEAVFGGRTVWHSEIDKAASKVLAHRWPDVPNLGSITEIDWATVEPVDVLCGGFPCTDVSSAGKRAGMHGTRSGLWSYMAEAIDALRPQYVVIENVRGLLNASANRPVGRDEDVMGYGGDGLVLRAIGAVLGDLADIGGYEARWVTVAAADVGAPHRRERVFILAADTSGDGRSRGAKLNGAPEESEPRHQDRGHSHGRVLEDGGRASSMTMGSLLPTPASRDHKGADHRKLSLENATKFRGEGGASSLADVACLLPTPAAADGSRGQDYARANRADSGGDDLVTAAVKAHNDSQWGRYAAAIARWEQIVGPSPVPTEPNRNGKPRLNPAFSQWMMGWPAGWVTDTSIGRSRVEQLRIIGNGVCPQQAHAAIRYLLSVAEVGA